MPLFEFACKQCGHVSEQLVAPSRKPACPRCGSKKLEKLLSAFSAPPSRSFSVPPCGSGCCPTRGQGCAGGGCPHAH